EDRELITAVPLCHPRRFVAEGFGELDALDDVGWRQAAAERDSDPHGGLWRAARHHHLRAVHTVALAVHASGRHLEGVAGAIGPRDAAGIDRQLTGHHEPAYVDVVRMRLRDFARRAGRRLDPIAIVLRACLEYGPVHAGSSLGTCHAISPRPYSATRTSPE